MWFIYGIRTLFLLNMVYLGFANEWLKILIVLSALVVTFIPDLLERVCHIYLTPFMKNFLIVFVVLAQWLGTYLRAYDYIEWWDVFLHGLSAVLVALAGVIILKALDPEFKLFVRKQYGLISWFLFFVVCSSAVFWEIFEYAGDTLLGTNAQLGSLSDTMEDMIICVLIGMFFSVYVGWSLKRERTNFVKCELMRFKVLNEEQDYEQNHVQKDK